MSHAPNNVEPECIALKGDDSIPNNPKLPLLVYRGVFDAQAGDLASLFEQRLADNNWTGAWRDGVFSYHHYHSTAHEVLAVYSGRADLQLGGENGVRLEVRAGDVLVLPAGVGHKNLGSSNDFGLVGAYPSGSKADLRGGDSQDRSDALDAIAKVPLPEADPVYGQDGPLTRIWSG